MREFLFRGKRKSNGKWVNGYYLKHTTQGGKRESFIYYVDTEYNVIPETIGQYTGLTDKNGVKIFEGDIVCTTFRNKKIINFIKYVEICCAFVIHKSNSCVDYLIDGLCEIEVIGNIHDNPELLE